MRYHLLFVIPILLPLISFSQGAKNISLYSRLQYDVSLSDIWGYTAEDGREYALVGLVDGTSIVDLSDPQNPVEISRIKGGNSDWKDIKTYKDKAYITGEYPEGLQIIDLSALPDTVTTSQHYFWQEFIPGIGQITACHNIFIEEKTGVAYLSGCAAVTGGVIMLDVTSEVPVYLGKTNTPYSHDSYVRNDTLYSSDAFDGFFTVIDVKNKANTIVLGSQVTPHRFTHNTWLSDDGKTIFTTDETNDGPIASYDISDLDNIKLLDKFYPEGTRGTGLIPHNVHVKNDFLVSSYYTEGVVITDASRPDDLIQVGQYDTFEGENGDFFGTWGAFPFFKSDIIIASDIENGLFVLKPSYKRAAFFDGNVIDSINGDGLSNTKIEVVYKNTTILETSSSLDGSFSLGIADSGIMEITFTRQDYKPKTIQVELVNGEFKNIDIKLLPNNVSLAASSLTGCATHQVTFSNGGLPITEFQWIFEGGSPAVSTEANPTITYDSAGMYNVKLSSSFDGEAITKTRTSFIEVLDIPVSNFSYERDRRAFSFTNLSENEDNLLWDFGDGATSVESNPIHQFAAGNLPIVTLTANNECGSQTFSVDLGGTTTGLESLKLLTTFKATPNPFTDQVIIEYEFSDALQSIHFQLIDISGKVLNRIPLSFFKGRLPISGLSLQSGIYFGQLVSEQGKSAVLKLVVH